MLTPRERAIAGFAYEAGLLKDTMDQLKEKLEYADSMGYLENHVVEVLAKKILIRKTK